MLSEIALRKTKMCCVTRVNCNRCKRVGKTRIDLCDRNTNGTMCVKTDLDISQHITIRPRGIPLLHVLESMGVA
jgi:hypothetical protein